VVDDDVMTRRAILNTLQRAGEFKNPLSARPA
jgi:hypothetical protein